MNTVFHPRTLDCACAEPVFLAGDVGPIWRITEGMVRLDRDRGPQRQPVQIAMPGDLIGAEALCDQHYRFNATALTACRLESVDAADASARERLLQQALLQQQSRSQDMAALRTGSVLQRITHLIHLLGFERAQPGLQPHAEAIRLALPTLREIAQVIDAKTETVCRVLGQLLPPRRRKAGAASDTSAGRSRRTSTPVGTGSLALLSA